MRLADIAKELRITNQELRHELAKTNFGISAGTHEVDDALARGMIRFLKTRVKPTLARRRTPVVEKEKPTEERSGESTVEVKKPKVESSFQNKNYEIIENKAPTPTIGPSVKSAPKEPLGTRPATSAQSMRPRQGYPERPQGNINLPISRRIEVSAVPVKKTDEPLPHTYYKSNKKKRHKGGRGGEEAILEVLKRHPHSGLRRKQQVARVKHDGEETDDLTLTALGIEKELDRERFREQKKHRALGQKIGPKAQPQIKQKSGMVELPEVLSVKEFAEKTGLAIPDVMARLVKNGILATINQRIDYDTAAIIADEMNVKVTKVQGEATSADLFAGNLEKLLHEDDPAKLEKRPPVISVMGHVDHGKTKILDTIRQANVMATEAGGITQHIGAYQVEKNGHKITFLDTPGHEAFTAMRARGAKATDIAILVVAADEGIKPQTVEAINHAREAGIPILVAINKIDKPAANIERVKGELVQYDLQPEDWGGKTVMVPVSAVTGQGMDQLLEMILLMADIEDLKANANRPAVGTVIESHLDPSLGPVATILINTGTLKIGNNILVGSTVGKIKAMHDHTGAPVKSVGPSGAVKVSGLSGVPQAGEILQTFTSESLAKRRASEMTSLLQERELVLGGSMVDRIISQISTGKMKFLKIVLKAESQGSLGAIMQELAKIKSNDMAIKVIHYGVGNITDTDVLMAAASQGLLIGFETTANAHVHKTAEKEKVDIRLYTIIYKLIDDLKAILTGMLEPEETTVELGKLKIKKIFLDKKKWAILGCEVIEGRIEKGATLRLMRNKEKIFETRLESLKHVNEEVRILEKGSECGIKINTPKPVAEDDILEAYKIESKERKLNS